MKNILFIVLLGIFISACGTKAQRFVRKINDGPTSVALVKDPTRVDGYIIVKEGTDFYAIDMKNASGNSYNYYMNNRVAVNYVGNGYYSDGSRTFEEGSTSLKDLEKMGAFTEEIKKEQLVEFYTLDLGLSEKRALEIATLTTSWNKTRNERSMTEGDLNAFSLKTFGVSYKEIESAISKHNEGDSKEIYSLIEKASSFNEISPEHMATIVNELIEL